MPYFRMSQHDGRWLFTHPDGRPFFSIGLNHVDSATLRYPENLHIWNEKYGNSQQRWLQEAVARDLRDWGFNTLGWGQEVIIRGKAVHRHSRNFTPEEYLWLDMPYCHMLPFTEAHQWEVETRYPDVFSADFEEWCDCVAREHCARLANDRNLIGYFYCDCPQWVHATKPHLKGPWFDPARLDSEAGRRELSEMAGHYYRTTHDAIRRYDPNHLILGDRYEAMALLPDEVLLAAVPYVDVLSFQFFSDEETIARAFARWHALTGKPLLLADACVPGRDLDLPEEECVYPRMLQALWKTPACVGWHYCGAYLRNRARKAGFRDESEAIISPAFVRAVTKANATVAVQCKALAGDG